MKSKNIENEYLGGLSRRDALKSAAAASLGVASGAFGVPHAGKDPSISGKDFIREENSKKGTRDWRLTKTKTVPGKINKILDNGRSKAIEGQRIVQSARTRQPIEARRHPARPRQPRAANYPQSVSTDDRMKCLVAFGL